MEKDETLKIGILGTGGRGRNLVAMSIFPASKEYNVEISAVYDIHEDRTVLGANRVEEYMGKRPVEAKSPEEIFNDPEIKAVIIPSSWEAHVDLAIQAMKAGKYAAFEVGGAYDIEDCWRLVRTYEETGVPCMMLENCCYGQRELMVTNMVRQGILGEIVHCEGGYHHDLRAQVAGGRDVQHYRFRNYLNRNCDNYPTHELGPIAKLLDINNGNRMVSLTSTASCSKGIEEYIAQNKDKDDPLRKLDFAQGDIVTTVIKCAQGQTIVLSLDTSLPRAYSRGFTVRGTKGSFFEDTDSFYIDNLHSEFRIDSSKVYGNAKDFVEKYQHPLWINYDAKGGHGGMDFLAISAFFEAVRKGTNPPIDVYDSAAWMSITALSEESILKGSAPVTVPDFTRGKWYMRNDIDYDLKYTLDRNDIYRDIY